MNKYHYGWKGASSRINHGTVTAVDLTGAVRAIRGMHSTEIWEIIYVIKVN